MRARNDQRYGGDIAQLGDWQVVAAAAVHAYGRLEVDSLRPQSEDQDVERRTSAFNAAGGITTSNMVAGRTANSAPLASAANPLAEFHYQTLSGSQMQSWVTAYGALSRPNFANFASPGETMSGSSIGATGYNATGVVSAISTRENVDGLSEILLNITMPEKAWKEGGAPRRLSVQYTATKRNLAPAPVYTLDISLRTLEKTPTKHKETLWMSFAPPLDETDRLEIDKLGSWVDPSDVLPYGGSNMHLHAVNSGARWQRKDSTIMQVLSQDVALVSVGERNPAPTPRVDGGTHYEGGRVAPDAAGGVHFSLVNNVWNT